jgi:rhodanese-related sulfurtransferase
MFWTSKNELVELGPDEVRQRMARYEIVLVDVREPAEFAREHIAGAQLFPLSRFNPAALPGGDPTKVVFQCAAGKRSAMAVARCQEAGVPANKHLRGGIAAWKAAGLPTVC